MTKRNITKWLMVSAALVLIAWDVVVATTPPKGDTMSEVLLGWAWQWSILPFGWGVIAGHLFWTVDRVVYKWERIAILWGILIAILLLDVAIPVIVMPAWPLVGGFIAGRVFWPQSTPQV